MYKFGGHRSSIPPQNRQLIALISQDKQQVDGFVGKVTLNNHLLNAVFEINSRAQVAMQDCMAQLAGAGRERDAARGREGEARKGVEEVINLKPSTLNPHPEP